MDHSLSQNILSALENYCFNFFNATTKPFGEGRAECLGKPKIRTKTFFVGPFGWERSGVVRVRTADQENEIKPIYI